LDAIQGRPEISYPCSWPYRIVCEDEAGVRAAIAELVGDAPHTLAKIGASASGRYSRLELVVTVRDEAQRNAIFGALGRVATVRFVL
jgi:putative lipoic acid-binding regulatory protein